MATVDTPIEPVPALGVIKGGSGGKRGSTKAQVHDVFSKRLTELRADARNQYESFQGVEQRQWQIPVEFLEDLFKIASLHEPAFNRDAINENYADVMKDPDSAGTNGDVISLKLQLDYVAAEERAFRVRHSSLCRSLCHAMGRRYGQATGRLFPSIRDQAEKVIANGGAA